MGGSGSGTWWRWDKRPVLDDRLQLRLSLLKKKGIIAPRTISGGGWSWKERGQVLLALQYVADTREEEGTMFCVRYATAKGLKMEYAIRMTCTYPNYGGERWWFHCPALGCGRRSAVLFYWRSVFVCRKCCGMPYQTQQQPAHDRLIDRAWKIQRKIGGFGDLEYTPRPKGMHASTYLHFHSEMERLRRKANTAFAARYPLAAAEYEIL